MCSSSDEVLNWAEESAGQGAGSVVGSLAGSPVLQRLNFLIHVDGKNNGWIARNASY